MSKQWPDPPPQPLVKLVLFLRRRLKKLVDLWIPQLTLFEDTIGAAVTQLLGSVARYGIVEMLEAGPCSAVDLAGKLDLQPDALHRALRALAYKGYFRLLPDGRFANNRLSRALLKDREDRGWDFCRYFSSPSNLAAWGRLDQVLKTGEDAFEAAHGCSVWEWFAAHPPEEATFAAAMQGRTYADAPLVATTYPFAEVESVCDVGGGQGGLLSEVVLRHPHLRATLLDVAGVLQLAGANLLRRGTSSRIEPRVGNFFESVPPGFQLYLLTSVLHDWPDSRCLQILGNCAAAMGSESRLLIVEFTPGFNQSEHFGAVSDVQMMMVTNGGRERSVSEFEALLRASGLVLCRTYPTASVSLMEARRF